MSEIEDELKLLIRSRHRIVLMGLRGRISLKNRWVWLDSEWRGVLTRCL